MSYKQQETRPARRAVRLHRLLLTWPQGTAARPGQHLTALTPGSEPPCAVLGAEEAPPQLLTSLGVGGARLPADCSITTPHSPWSQA